MAIIKRSQIISIWLERHFMYRYNKIETNGNYFLKNLKPSALVNRLMDRSPAMLEGGSYDAWKIFRGIKPGIQGK